MLEYLRDGSAQTSTDAATLRKKLRVKLTVRARDVQLVVNHVSSVMMMSL